MLRVSPGNAALEYLRRHRRGREVSLDEADDISDGRELIETFLDSERKAALYRALGKIRPEYSQALWLTYFEELSYKEIARVMKKSESAVKSLIHRAKPALRIELEKEGFGYDDL